MVAESNQRRALTRRVARGIIGAHMFPLHDENPTEITPVLTFAFIGLCTGIWLFVQGGGVGVALLDSLCRFGAIPSEITARADLGGGIELAPGYICSFGGLTWQAVLTSMFLHGGWMHLIGNMWFLWIFGNNVEDSMGHTRFALFYLLTGAAATLVHVATDPSSSVPTIGASGAISGIMGAYLVVYPRVRVQTLFIIVLFVRVFPLPAWVMLGYWFVIQVVSSAMTPAGGGGVAFGAHIGGFVAGVALIKLFARPQLVEAKRAGVQLRRHEIPRRGW